MCNSLWKTFAILHYNDTQLFCCQLDPAFNSCLRPCSPRASYAPIAPSSKKLPLRKRPQLQSWISMRFEAISSACSRPLSPQRRCRTAGRGFLCSLRRLPLVLEFFPIWPVGRMLAVSDCALCSKTRIDGIYMRIRARRLLNFVRKFRQLHCCSVAIVHWHGTVGRRKPRPFAFSLSRRRKHPLYHASRSIVRRSAEHSYSEVTVRLVLSRRQKQANSLARTTQ